MLQQVIMKTYLAQLETLSQTTHVDLASAFKFAGIPYSTYYRNMRGVELRYTTAIKVKDAIELIAKHREVYKNKCLPKKKAKGTTTKTK